MFKSQVGHCLFSSNYTVLFKDEMTFEFMYSFVFSGRVSWYQGCYQGDGSLQGWRNVTEAEEEEDGQVTPADCGRQCHQLG